MKIQYVVMEPNSVNDREVKRLDTYEAAEQFIQAHCPTKDFLGIIEYYIRKVYNNRGN
jgi:hypothetical protein